MMISEKNLDKKIDGKELKMTEISADGVPVCLIFPEIGSHKLDGWKYLLGYEVANVTMYVWDKFNINLESIKLEEQ